MQSRRRFLDLKNGDMHRDTLGYKVNGARNGGETRWPDDWAPGLSHLPRAWRHCSSNPSVRACEQKHLPASVVQSRTHFCACRTYDMSGLSAVVSPTCELWVTSHNFVSTQSHQQSRYFGNGRLSFNAGPSMGCQGGRVLIASKWGPQANGVKNDVSTCAGPT